VGLLDALEPDSFDRRYTDRELLRRIWGYFGCQRTLMVMIVAALILGAVMGAAFPILLSRGVDDLAKNISAGRTFMLAGVILLAGGAVWSFNVLRHWYSARVVGDVVLAFRTDAFNAVMCQDMAFFDEHSPGGITSRVATDTQAFATMAQIVLDVTGQVLLILFMTLVLFHIDVRLAFVTVLLAILVAAVTLVFRMLARHATQILQRALGRLNTHLHESLGGIVVARNFRQEERLYREFLLANSQWYQASARVGTLFSGIFPLMLTLAGVGTVAVVYFGGRQVMAGTLTPGEWYLFLQSVALFWDPLTNIASFWGQFQHGLSAGERVFALIDAQPRVVQVDHRSVQQMSGHIEFRDVAFRYTDREKVLENFHLNIEAGETVALVGHTGAGKSSIARLISRSYEFQAGCITVDGQDIRTLDLDAYRRHVGIVPQMPFLFSGTVADNIRYACPGASDEEVVAAAYRVAGGDWLQPLERGLETPVGERGKNLSTGQRQLVALARVLLHDPSILILDEATASIDPLTEVQIQEALDVVVRGRTAIIIAHRLPTVRRADSIVVLEKGKVIEQGSHNTLMRVGGHYCQLYDRYFRHQAPDFDEVERRGIRAR